MQRQSVRHQIHGDKTQESSQTTNQFLGKQCHSSRSSGHLSSKALSKQTDHINSPPGRISENENSLQFLQSKLHSETENILKWKVSTELEISEKERKLAETEEIVERQRKNLFELQMHSEQLSQRLQVELKNREELTAKIENTRNICSIIRDHCNKLTTTLNVCVDEKENLKSMYSQQNKDLEQLKEQFKDIDGHFRMEIEQMEELVKEERSQRNKMISEANAVHCILNEKIDELSKNNAIEKDKANHLNQQFQQCLGKIRVLEAEKEENIKSLSSVRNQVVDLESQIAAQKCKFELDIKEAMTTIEQERSRSSLLQNQFAEAQENLKQLHLMEEKIMLENTVLKETLATLEVSHQKLNEELRKTADDHSMILAERHRLLSELKALEESNLKLQSLKMEYDKLVQENNVTVDDLKDACDKIICLTNSCKEKEDMLKAYDSENKQIMNAFSCSKESEKLLREKLATSESLEQEMRQKVQSLEKEINELRSELLSLESKSTLDASELTALIEEGRSDLSRKDNQLKSLNKEVEKLECLTAQLQEQEKIQLEQISALEDENKALKKSFDGEIEKVDALREEIKMKTGQNDELSKDLKEVKDQTNERAKMIESYALEKLELEEKLASLQDVLDKASEQRNSFEKKFMDAVKEKDSIQLKSDSEIKEMVAVLEKYKRECDGIVSQKEANISKLSTNLEEIHKKKEDLEEQVMKLQKEYNSSKRKIVDMEKEKEIVEKTLQVKVMDLELKLTAKEKEIAEKEVALLKNEAIKSPSVEKVFSTPSRKHSLVMVDKNSIVTPKSGISTTPMQLKCSPHQNSSILKEPNTPGGLKKQVTFQEDTSDTDASSVDAMILDNSDLMSRFEALERGVKMMTPIRVFPSPKNRKKMELKKAEMQLKNEENNSAFAVKKARMMRTKSMAEGVNMRGSKYQDGSGLKKLLKPAKHSDLEQDRNTGLDLDELFEMVED